jgi:hypothetical protein
MDHAARMKQLLLVALVLGACGKSGGSAAGGGSAASAAPTASASGAAAPAPAPTGPQDTCVVHVRGDETLDYTASAAKSDRTGNAGKVIAGTDYWMTDDELRSALKTMSGLMSKKSDSDIAAEVEADMKKDPRLVLLLINCANDQGHLNLMPSGGSHYADVPFGPKKYAISPDPKAGEFTLMFGLIGADGKRTSYRPSAPGTLELTKFDKTGIAGTFHFVAQTFGKDKTVTVDGTFDYSCRGDSVCAK